jgi:PAS domain S-box-containing protein
MSGDPATGARAPQHSALLDLLNERLQFESLLSRLSATFVNLPAEEVDSQIERGLRQIVEFLGIERSSLGQFSEDGSQLVVTHSYAVSGTPPYATLDLAKIWPWYTEQIRRGKLLRFTRLPEELPPEAVHEREHVVKAGGPRSHLAIPFKVGDAILGGIGFGTFRQHEWSDDIVQSLQLVGEIFANALARQRSEEVRRRSEERLQILLESTHAMPWVADAETWRFTFVGPQAAMLLGYPLEAWYEANFWPEHLHSDDREHAVAFCQDHSRRDSDYQFEYRMVAADGQIVWIHDIVNVVRQGGAPTTLRGFMIDVTALRSAEEESRNLRDQLARAGRVQTLGQLAASIAHEVNQPLCAIVSNAQTLRRMVAAGGFDMEELQEALQDITQDGQRASAVIARIRGSLQKAPTHRAPVDVNELIREVAVLMGRDAVRRRVTVKVQLAEDLPAVLGDRVQLQQVILNLVTNGADALDGVPRERRELVIRSTADRAGGVAVAVQDSGVGIDPKNLGHIFDALFTTKPGGMGMGLAICKSIIEAHGGRISASPNAGGGSTFQFTVPGRAKGDS